MITNNLSDLSSYEPEAILASLPREHPKVAAGLAIGREASQTGHLDTAELSRIANELYAEGFPAGSPFIAHQPAAIPSTASFSDGGNTLEPSANKSLSPLQSHSTEATNSDYAGHAFAQNGFYSNINSPFNGPLDVDLSTLALSTVDNHISELQNILQELNDKPSAGDGFNGISAPNANDERFYFTDKGNVANIKPVAQSTHPAFDANLVRKDFPILNELVNGRPLIWLDNAATTQKPQSVIDRISYFYQHENSNIHRAAHEIAARATDAYEGVREKVRRFINAPSVDNVIFVRGTTEAINLVAKTWGAKHLGQGDEIVISHLEHHANIVPWQQLCTETAAILRVAPVDDSGQILLAEYQKLLTSRTKLVSFTQVSNALGTVTPAAQMIQMAHRVGAKVLLDGAQSVSHMRTDVQQLDADFLCFQDTRYLAQQALVRCMAKLNCWLICQLGKVVAI